MSKEITILYKTEKQLVIKGLIKSKVYLDKDAKAYLLSDNKENAYALVQMDGTQLCGINKLEETDGGGYPKLTDKNLAIGRIILTDDFKISNLDWETFSDKSIDWHERHQSLHNSVVDFYADYIELKKFLEDLYNAIIKSRLELPDHVTEELDRKYKELKEIPF